MKDSTLLLIAGVACGIIVVADLIVYVVMGRW